MGTRENKGEKREETERDAGVMPGREAGEELGAYDNFLVFFLSKLLKIKTTEY